MSSINPTIEVRADERLDKDRLLNFLDDHFDELEGPMEISQFPSGRSNLTYLLAFPSRHFVLRRPPHGTKAKSAHDMLREFTFMRALKPQFDTVPEVYLHCAETHIMGSEFFVMEAVPGELIHEAIPTTWNWNAEKTRAFCSSFWDRMIELHSLDLNSLELGGYARPSGYVERQVTGWNRRYANAQTPDAPDCGTIMDWLTASMPKEEEAAVLHNDFRIDNVILDASNPMEVRAVLDWEMAAVGNPLMDLGNSLAYWTEQADGQAALQAASQPSACEGMFSRQEVIHYYGSKTGRDVSQFRFYYVSGLFRLAAIIQQIYYRYYHGQTTDTRFDGWVREVWRLSDRCQKIIDGAQF